MRERSWSVMRPSCDIFRCSWAAAFPGTITHFDMLFIATDPLSHCTRASSAHSFPCRCDCARAGSSQRRPKQENGRLGGVLASGGERNGCYRRLQESVGHGHGGFFWYVRRRGMGHPGDPIDRGTGARAPATKHIPCSRSGGGVSVLSPAMQGLWDGLRERPFVLVVRIVYSVCVLRRRSVCPGWGHEGK